MFVCMYVCIYVCVLNLASAGSRWGRRVVALEILRAVAPGRRLHGWRSRAKVFVRCSKELLEILVLVLWGVYVDDTQSDLRKN